MNKGGNTIPFANNRIIYFLLFILTLVCYWPLVSGLFSAKNDNLTAFLPVRFHIVEALRNFELPLWTPYMYLGYPLHGDMQGGAWNPVVWVLSIFGPYKLASLHAEILLYIWIGGVGMFQLLTRKTSNNVLSFIGSAAYLMCGFITDVGGSNLPFLAAAAFIPWVLLFYYRLLKTPTARNALLTAIAGWLLFVSAYPSFVILTAYALAFATIVVLASSFRQPAYIRKTCIYIGLAVVVVVALCLPAILSYFSILPYYQRSSGLGLAFAQQNSYLASNLLSLVAPLAPIKDPGALATDLISRNSYFNLLLLPPLVYSLFHLTKFRIVGWLGIIFFLLFALGPQTPVRALCYELLPLMDFFRHPSNARLFVIIGALALSVDTIHTLSLATLLKRLTWCYWAMGIILLVAVTIFWIQLPATNNQFRNEDGRALKSMLDSLSLHQAVLINLLIQCLSIAVFLFFAAKKNWKGIITFFILNSFILAQTVIPFTLVSKESVASINRLTVPIPGFPVPSLQQPVGYNNEPEDIKTVIGSATYYQKKIALPDVVYTPTFMKPLEAAMHDSSLNAVIRNTPYAALSIDANDMAAFVSNGFQKGIIDTSLSIMSLTANEVVFKTNQDQVSMLFLQQINLPGWSCLIDQKETTIQKANGCMMAVWVAKGKHEVKFRYLPDNLNQAFAISVLTLIICLFWITNWKPFVAHKK